ncbi:MAG: hypothetical protein ACPGXL_03775 [Chitinophagales bacterium]
MTLNPKEIKRFEEYVRSPFYNKNEKVIQLIQIIRKAYPNWQSRSLANKKVFAKIFPKERFDERKVRYIMSYLTKLLEGFMTYMELEADKIDQTRLFLVGLTKRELQNYFEANFDNVKVALDKTTIRDSKHYFDSYTIHKVATDSLEASRVRDDNKNLLTTLNQLDLFYLSTKMRYISALLNRGNILAENHHEILLDDLMNHVQRNPEKYQQEPTISVYHALNEMLLHKNEGIYYHDFMGLLKKHGEQLTKVDLEYLYMIGRNYCIRALNAGMSKDFDFLAELFRLYKIMIEKELWATNMVNYFPHSVYKNVITTGLRLKDITWTGQFIEDFKEKIEPKYRAAAYTYNKANFYFATKKYEEVLALFNAAELKLIDVFYQLSYRTLQVKTYYELGLDRVLESFLESFRIYLIRNKELPVEKENIYKDFIKFVKRLYRIKTGNKKILPVLKNDLFQKDLTVMEKKWLQAKILELE